VFPAGKRGFSRDFLTFLGRKSLGSYPSALESSLSGTLFTISEIFFDLPGGDLSDRYSVSDHVGGSLLSFWAFGHEDIITHPPSVVILLSRRVPGQTETLPKF